MSPFLFSPVIAFLATPCIYSLGTQNNAAGWRLTRGSVFNHAAIQDERRRVVVVAAANRHLSRFPIRSRVCVRDGEVDMGGRLAQELLGTLKLPKNEEVDFPLPSPFFFPRLLRVHFICRLLVTLRHEDILSAPPKGRVASFIKARAAVVIVTSRRCPRRVAVLCFARMIEADRLHNESGRAWKSRSRLCTVRKVEKRKGPVKRGLAQGISEHCA